MTERTVAVVVKAKVDGLVSAMHKAKASVDDLTKAAAPQKAAAFSNLADKAALAGAGVAAGLGLAIKRFADFDQAMSAVKANTGATGKEFDDLRALAIKLGADSQFSAKEAAEGINEMGKAGVKTKDIMGGGLKGALDLAAAGQISVADAAETASTAMTQFKLSGDKVPHIADLLANAANKAQGGVGDMAQALKQAGLVAASTGLSIEETTAGLTAFASAGLIGSDAGTSFKTMLQRLSAPADQAKEEMDKLGISAYDSNGQFVGLANVAGQLKSSMEKLTPAQRNSAMATIFGSDAVRAANVLYDQGAEGINKWTKEVSEQGAAARQAATLTDNLKGDIERLGGALDSVFIKTGSGANGGLRTLVQGLTGFIDKVGQIPGPVLLAGGALTSLALLAPKGILKYRAYKAELDAVGLSFDKISAKAPRTGAALEKTAGVVARTGKAFAIAAIAAGTLDQAFGKSGSGLGVQGLTKDLLDSNDAVDEFSARVEKYAKNQSNWWNSDQVRSYGDVLKAAFDPSVGQSIDKVAGSLVGISTDVSNANERLGELDQVLSGLVSAGQGQKANDLFKQFADAAAKSGVSVDELKSKLPGYTEALAGAGTAAGDAANAGIQLDNVSKANAASAKSAADAVKDWTDALNALNKPALDVREAARNVEEAVDNVTASIKDNGKTLDINTEKGRKNQSALDDVAGSLLDQIGAMQANGASQGQLQTQLDKSRDRLIKVAEKFGMSKKDAKAYADQVLKIPPTANTTATFTVHGLTGLKAAGEYLKGLKDKHVTLTVGTVRLSDGTTVNAGQFAGGGYTGDGYKYEPAGIVHKGEYVFTKAQTASIGKATLDYFARSGRLPGYANGGQVTGRMVPAALAPIRSSSVAHAAPSGPAIGELNVYPSAGMDESALAASVVRRAMMNGV